MTSIISTTIIGAIVLGGLAFIIYRIYKNHKSGQCHCGCDCGCCDKSCDE